MNRMTPAILLLAQVILPLLWPARPVSAHGGEPRLEISPEVVRPGEMLQIRGVDFGPEQQVTLVLGGSLEVMLGSVMGDSEGAFLLTIGLPDDLQEGTYVVHAISAEHKVDSPVFIVRGAAVNQDGGQETRQEADGLLAAVPTYAPGANSTQTPGAPAHQEPEWQETIMYLMIISLASVGLLLAFGLRAGRMR